MKKSGSSLYRMLSLAVVCLAGVVILLCAVLTQPILTATAADQQQGGTLFLPLVAGGQHSSANSDDSSDFGAAATTGTTYYVDCTGGNDANNGKGTASAWKSITKANSATLNPGDHLLFKRDCTWTGPLMATWHGTAALSILIGAYGTGNLPIFQDGYSSDVRISGTYQIIEYLESTLSSPPNPDPNCKNQPVAWKAGFSFDNGSSYNTVRHSTATRMAIGIFFDPGSNHNHALSNTLTGNNVVSQNDSSGALGAMGVELHGDSQEVGYNYFANNRTICTYNGIVESNSIELVGATNSNIHHNTSYNDRVFSELGSNSSVTAQNNTYAYNLFVSWMNDSSVGPRFIVTRGYGHPYGPVLNTILYNNTVRLTGPDSKALSCQMCTTNILIAENNILWADNEPFSTDGPFAESNNVYWSSTGKPLINLRGMTLSSTSKVVDPQFVDPGNKNYQLKSTSPAINKGTSQSVTAGYIVDLLKKSVPTGAAVDIGGYEY